MAVTSLSQMLLSTRNTDAGLIAIVAPTTVLGPNSTGNGTANWVFDFVFDGVGYTAGNVSATGRLRLAGTSVSTNNADLFGSDANIILAPWWDDLKTAESTGAVVFEVQGTAPWRRCVLQWDCYLVSSQTAADHDRVKYQVVLYETSNRVEYRYGPRVRTGSPGGTPSASIGLKGLTVVDTNNYRNLRTFELALGGANTSTTSLGTSQFDTLSEKFVYAIEPAYPMCGRFLPCGDELLSGIVGPDAEPLRTFANNVNWHYCHHTPSPANWLAELQDGVLQSGLVTEVVPIHPSQDGLEYRAHFRSYNDTSANLDLKLWGSALASPRWDVDADWADLGSPGKVAVSEWQDWDDVTISITSAHRWLRIQMQISTGVGAVVSGLVHPVVLTEPPNTTAIGWTRMGIGILAAHSNMPVGPEWMNRCWKNIALVLRDRRQVAFSMVRPLGSVYAISAVVSRPSRTMTFFPLALTGQGGATLSVRAYASAYGGPGKIHIRSSGGGTVTLTVPDAGGVYTGLTATFEVLGESPVVAVTYEPAVSGSLRVASIVGIWTPGD